MLGVGANNLGIQDGSKPVVQRGKLHFDTEAARLILGLRNPAHERPHEGTCARISMALRTH